MKYKKTIALSICLLLWFYVEQFSFAQVRDFPLIEGGLVVTAATEKPMAIVELRTEADGSNRIKAIDKFGHPMIFSYAQGRLTPIVEKRLGFETVQYGIGDYNKLLGLRYQMAQAMQGDIRPFKYNQISGKYEGMANEAFEKATNK